MRMNPTTVYLCMIVIVAQYGKAGLVDQCVDQSSPLPCLRLPSSHKLT